MTDASTITYTLPFTGAVSRTLLDHLSDRPLNVKDFGAAGDVASNDPADIALATDDTAAFQAALAAAKQYATNRNHKIVVPAGKYKITAPLLMDSNITFEGEGLASTYLYGEGSGLVGRGVIETGSGAASRRFNVSIGNMLIRNTATNGIGVFLENATDYIVSNVIINDAKIGVKMYGNAGFGSYYNTLFHVVCGACETGFLIDSNVTGSEVNENSFYDCRSHNATYPFKISSGNNNRFYSPNAETAGAPAYFYDIASGVEDTVVIGPRAESASAGGTAFYNAGIRTVILGGHYSNISGIINDVGSGTWFNGGSVSTGPVTPPGPRTACRYFILEKENAAGGGFYHTEMKLYDSSGAIAMTSGMVTNPTGGLAGFSAAALVDGSTSVPAFHTDSAAAGTRIVVDFGAGNEKLVTQADIYVNGSVVASWKGIDSTNGTTGTTVFTGLDCSGGAGWKTKTI